MPAEVEGHPQAPYRRGRPLRPLDQLCLSHQCGFSSTVHGKLLSEADQWRKLARTVEVAREVWGIETGERDHQQNSRLGHSSRRVALRWPPEHLDRSDDKLTLNCTYITIVVVLYLVASPSLLKGREIEALKVRNVLGRTKSNLETGSQSS
jgi:hypothetical protein